MNLWRSLDGVIVMRMTAAEPEKALTSITQEEIALFGIHHESDLVCSFSIRRQDFSKLSTLCEKQGYSLTVQKKLGIHYRLHQLLRRKMLITGIGILLIGAFLLPTRILFIRVEGNHRIPQRYILSTAEEIGIRFGAPRGKVRSERIKNALLDAIPQLQWAGVNTSGCTATISVREREVSPVTKESAIVSSIVAGRDGYVLSCVVTQGSAQVQPGQVVQRGQTLISGYSEHGLTIQATQAKGEVIAQTTRDLTVYSPVKCLSRTGRIGTSHRLSLLLGKKRIFFWKGSGISDAECVRMYKQYDFTLPGGFTLPLALCVETFQHFALAEGESADASLEDFAGRYLKEQMIAGSILRSVQSRSRCGDVLRLQGTYICTEAIGRVKPEQIGEVNGKTNGENR